MKDLSNTASNRIMWIDMARGWAIFLVVLGHVFDMTEHNTIEYILYVIIYSFHMPLFFVLSGMNVKNEINFRTFISTKVKRVLIPYFKYSFIYFIFELLFKLLTSGESLKYLIGYFEVFLSKANLINTLLFTHDSYFSRFWFLIVLFVSQIVIYWMMKINKKWIHFIIFIFGILLNRVLYRYEVILPFCLNEVLLATPFLYLGMEFKKIFVDIQDLYLQHKKIIILSVFSVLAYIYCILTWFKWGHGIADMYNSNIKALGLFLVMGLTMSFLTFYLFSSIDKASMKKNIICDKIINYGIDEDIKYRNPIANSFIKLGRSSLKIYGIHYCYLWLWWYLMMKLNVSEALYGYPGVKLLMDLVGAVLIIGLSLL